MKPTLARAGALAAAALLAGGPAAAAVAPPQVDPALPPPAGTAGPAQPLVQRSPCTTGTVLPGTDPAAQNPNPAVLDLPAAWRLSRGAGETVAVIDTGVTPGPRLPEVQPGGDYVAAGDGLTDCDGHGTLVAGLIAGRPGDDGFSGVAPDARLIAIRQTSAHYQPADPGDDPQQARAAIDVASLARAVVRAADLGARVINISVATCLPADRTPEQAELGAALRYAAVERDAVIVAAAGNLGNGGPDGAGCEPNPLGSAADPQDPRNWAGVASVSVPSWWQPYVLSVGSVDAAGAPSAFTMPGPWVGVAAPGEQIVSVSNAPDGGLANALTGREGEPYPARGTSYAAAYVSGVAALVRSRFPQLRADEVIHRITATAQGAGRSPSNLVGTGRVDPVAALTWDVPPPPEGPPAPRRIDPPPAPPERDPLPRIVAFTGVGVLVVALLSGLAIKAHRRKDDTV